MPDYEPAFQSAVREFWHTRASQADRQALSGRLDAGTRGHVTGGKHLDSIARLVAEVMVNAGLEAPGPMQLPGYYRRSKNWDLVSRFGPAVGAVVELKSQVGSIGNNANNRIEEMIGQAICLWKAARENLLGPTPPWFGYVMLVEDSPVSTKKTTVSGASAAFPPDPVFLATSYLDRYCIALERLRLERDMDQVCLAATRPDGTVWYPNPTMTFQVFATSLHARGLQLSSQMPQ